MRLGAPVCRRLRPHPNSHSHSHFLPHTRSSSRFLGFLPLRLRLRLRLKRPTPDFPRHLSLPFPPPFPSSYPLASSSLLTAEFPRRGRGTHACIQFNPIQFNAMQHSVQLLRDGRRAPPGVRGGGTILNFEEAEAESATQHSTRLEAFETTPARHGTATLCRPLPCPCVRIGIGIWYWLYGTQCTYTMLHYYYNTLWFASAHGLCMGPRKRALGEANTGSHNPN